MSELNQHVPFPMVNGVLVLRGHSLLVSVSRGHLVMEDHSFGEHRRSRFSRIDRALKRIIVMGPSGAITLDAIKWVNDVGIPLVQVHPDGRVLMVAAPSAAHRAGVRRAQALVGASELGLTLSKELVAEKIRRQQVVLDDLDPGEEPRNEMTLALQSLLAATDFMSLRQSEARAAGAYWSAWRGVPVRIAQRDRSRLPTHWVRFGARHSPLGARGAGRAVNPANAILNYLYAILEAEARIACLAVGLDPMLGILHTDRTARDALALDLMEPVRPAVDRFLLDLLTRRELTHADLFELPDGNCRLMPPLAQELAVTAPRWARLVLGVAQGFATELERVSKKGVGTPTHHGEAPRWRRKRTQVRAMREFGRRPDPSEDPRYQEPAVQSRQRTLAKVYRANSRWRASNAPVMSREEYLREVVPSLGQVRLARLMTATGLSNASCSKIRRGLTVPHFRHWSSLAMLARQRDKV